jgi:hypothetical protein
MRTAFAQLSNRAAGKGLDDGGRFGRSRQHSRDHPETLCAMDSSAPGTSFEPGAGRMVWQVFGKLKKIAFNY